MNGIEAAHSEAVRNYIPEQADWLLRRLATGALDPAVPGSDAAQTLYSANDNDRWLDVTREREIRRKFAEQGIKLR